MNDKVKEEKGLTSKVSDLLSAGMSASNIIEKLSDTSAKNPHKKETIRDVIRDLKANLGSREDKGGKGNYTPKNIKKMQTVSREMAKGGEVKKYMGGGSVRKNKSNMITKRGWGASRKT